MHPVRKQRLYLVLFVVLFSSAAIGLVVYALSGNINLFFPSPRKLPRAMRCRPADSGGVGMVVDGSVQRSDTSLAVRFELTDYEATVPVVYVGILPGLCSARGRARWPRACWTITVCCRPPKYWPKHDENYMPPEVADALEKSGYDEKGNLK